METSTPISIHREPKPIILDEDSPINDANQLEDNSVSSNEKIPDCKLKAGMSNELNSLAVTPESELSSETMGRRLALHSIDIVKASQDNPLIAELKEDHEHILELSMNTFSNKEKVDDLGMSPVIKWSAEVDDNDDVKVARSAGMDGMNKTPVGKSLRSVGMDRMNKTSFGGGRGYYCRC